MREVESRREGVKRKKMTIRRRGVTQAKCPPPVNFHLLSVVLLGQGERRGSPWHQPWERKVPREGPPCLPGQTVSLSSSWS